MNYGLRYYDDPILREKTSPVTEITQEIRELVDAMHAIMMEHHGIGIAAPQVGSQWRIFLSRVAYEDDEGELHLREAQVYINPVLSHPRGGVISRVEGCLSIPGLRAPVNRAEEIHVQAMNMQGVLFEETLRLYAARVIFHEYDHLDGILFIDRLTKKARKACSEELQHIKEKYHSRFDKLS